MGERKTDSTDRVLRPSRLVNLALLVVSTAAVVAVAEGFLRWRYAEPQRQASADVQAIQEQLQLHPALGFTWKPDLRAEDQVMLAVRDVQFPPLTTDAFGFKNTPSAIERRATGESPTIIGLGDSFMEHAHGVFHDRFAAEGAFYYSMAIHRQSVPHYEIILNEYALPLKPEVIVLGLFENDFAEAADFEDWRESNVDWFAYHSGTWCGPPVEMSLLRRALAGSFKGFRAASGNALNRIRDGSMTLSGPTPEEVRLVTEGIRRIHHATEELGIQLVLVLIPSRATATSEYTQEAQVYDIVVAGLGTDTPTVLDLRRLFSEHPRPESLYYQDDAHWNAEGMGFAAEAIIQQLDRLEPIHNEN